MPDQLLRNICHLALIITTLLPSPAFILAAPARNDDSMPMFEESSSRTFGRMDNRLPPTSTGPVLPKIRTHIFDTEKDCRRACLVDCELSRYQPRAAKEYILYGCEYLKPPSNDFLSSTVGANAPSFWIIFIIVIITVVVTCAVICTIMACCQTSIISRRRQNSLHRSTTTNGNAVRSGSNNRGEGQRKNNDDELNSSFIQEKIG